MYIFTSIVSSILARYLKEQLSGEATTTYDSFGFYIVMAHGIGLISHLVVAIWLYQKEIKNKGKAILWFLLGLFTNFNAILMYIAINIYENQKLSTGSLKDSDTKDPVTNSSLIKGRHE